MSEAEKSQKKLSGGIKFLLDFGPLLLFFWAVKTYDIMVATAVLMGGVGIAALIHWIVERHVPKMLIFSSLLVMVLGGLTLWLNNDTFVKMKMTILMTVIAAILLVGKMRGKLFLKSLMGEALDMTDYGWHIFTRNYALCFLAIAAANEIVWRTQSDETWAAFKTFGVMPVMLIFMVGQIMALQKHITFKDEES